jgi:hypothetical protein
MSNYKLELDFPGQSENLVFVSDTKSFYAGSTPKFNECTLSWNHLVTNHYCENVKKFNPTYDRLINLIGYCYTNMQKPVSGLGIFTKEIVRPSFTEEKCVMYVEKLIMYDLMPMSINFGELDYSTDSSINIVITWKFTKADYELKLVQIA